MRNILSFKQPIPGKEIKEWISFHTANETEYTPIASQMKRFSNISDEDKYQIVLHPRKTIHGERFRKPIVVKIKVEHKADSKQHGEQQI